MRTYMIAANIMTIDVTTLRRGADMRRALQLIVEKRVRQVPVVDEDGRLAGVITPEGLMEALLARSPSGEAPGLPEFIGNIDSLAERGVDALLSAGFVSVRPDTKTTEIAAIFADGRRPVESVMVVDDQERLLGIISPHDVFERLWEYAEKKDR